MIAFLYHEGERYHPGVVRLSLHFLGPIITNRDPCRLATK